MAQGNFSVRLPDDLQAVLDEHVKLGAKRNVVVVTALREHFQMSAQIGQLKPGGIKPHVNDEGMQVGAVKPEFGSRLKQPPKKPDRWTLKK